MAPTEALRVDAPREDCRVIAASGELDAYTAPRLRERIHASLAEPGVEQLVIDLSDATFLDSSALGVLVGALKRMGELQGRLDIVLPSAHLRRIFEITSLDQVFALHETRASALAAAAPYGGSTPSRTNESL